MNILIVEDDTAIREGVAEFLKENEYEVFCAEDGEKALEILKKQRDTSGAAGHYAAEEKWNRSVKRTTDIQ